jgi:serine/threonine protein kinase
MTVGLQPGDVVGGRYRIIRRLGMGGMGAVYLANAEGLAGFEKLVALKVAHEHVATDKHVMEMFLSEARLAARLQHANIGQVYDLGQAGEQYFIAMEYIAGADLRSLISAVQAQGGRLPVPILVSIVARLLEGLDYAHALRDKQGKPLKLVHRDVTPVNTLLSYTGDVKLIDFGIAKAADQATRTKTGIVRGKLSYMSPEQARGQPLDRRSDLFAVGIILYELLIGRRPFDAESNEELMQNIVAAKYTPARQIDPDVPPELEAITARALTLDRNDRWENAAAMQQPLDRFLMARQMRVGARELAGFVARLVPPPDEPRSGEVTGETKGKGVVPPEVSTGAAQLGVAEPPPRSSVRALEPPTPLATPAQGQGAAGPVPSVPELSSNTVIAPQSRRWLFAGIAALLGLLVTAALWYRFGPPLPIRQPQKVAPKR